MTRAAVVLALATIYFARVFRLPSDAMLTTGIGDWVDPYFINALLEHWYRSLTLVTSPVSPPMFFPVERTIGYSHGLILYAPFYAISRVFLDPLPAHNVTLFLVFLTGSLCLYFVLQRFGLRFFESVVLTAFFVTSENVINGGTGVWSQRASVFLIPPILLMGLASMRIGLEPARLAAAGLTGLLVSLLFTQDFYMGALALLVLTLFIAGALVLLRKPIGEAVVALRQTVGVVERLQTLPAPASRWWLFTAIAAVVFALGVAIHPIERMTIASMRFSSTDPGRPLGLALFTAGWYLFWHFRRLDRTLGAESLDGIAPPLVKRVAAVWLRNRRHLMAFATGAFVGGVVFLWVYLSAYREHPSFPQDQLMSSLRPFQGSVFDGYESRRSFMFVFLAGFAVWIPWFGVSRQVRLGWLWVALVSILVLIIPLRFGDFSIWRTVLAPLPGLSVIRDPTRIIPLYELAVTLAAALTLLTFPRQSAFRLASVGLVLMLIVTDWNRQVFDFGRRNDEFERWVDSPVSIDPSCKSFFIKGASPQYMSRSFHMWGLYNIDAMFIAMKHDIPTLNGYSAWTPTGWSLANPQESDYPARVRVWIDDHQLRDVCELDIERRTMRKFP